MTSRHQSDSGQSDSEREQRRVEFRVVVVGRGVIVAVVVVVRRGVVVAVVVVVVLAGGRRRVLAAADAQPRRQSLDVRPPRTSRQLGLWRRDPGSEVERDLTFHNERNQNVGLNTD